jgi:hypothetical protein
MCNNTKSLLKCVIIFVKSTKKNYTYKRQFSFIAPAKSSNSYHVRYNNFRLRLSESLNLPKIRSLIGLHGMYSLNKSVNDEQHI